MIIMLQIDSELSPIKKVGADIVFEQGSSS